MRRPASLRSFTHAGVLALGAVVSLVVLASAHAASFSAATVAKLENRVNYGERRGERSATRPATVSDVIRERNFLLTETDSRAELRYEDGSIVRLGQNAVFSFDSASRTLTLEKGTLLFHIPKTSGGGVIKTPSLTAAITGTSGKVSENIIAIVEGSVRLIPSGRVVNAGEFARRNADGSITIAKFDPATVLAGKLVNFNGLLPGFVEWRLVKEVEVPSFRLPDLNALDRANNLPGSIGKFFPQPADRNRTRVNVPPPSNTPQAPGTGGGSVGY